MGSTNIKVSTIQFVEEDGTWNNGDHTFYKYKLHLNNGEKPEFLAKNKSTIEKLNVGDEVRYSYKKEGQNFAKIEKEFNQPKIYNMSKNSEQTTNGMSQQESIARSVAWNNVSQFIFSEEFQKYDDSKLVDQDGKQLIFSTRQQKMINQAASAANIIYRELLTKPK